MEFVHLNPLSVCCFFYFILIPTSLQTPLTSPVIFSTTTRGVQSCLCITSISSLVKPYFVAVLSLSIEEETLEDDKDDNRFFLRIPPEVLVCNSSEFSPSSSRRIFLSVSPSRMPAARESTVLGPTFNFEVGIGRDFN